MNGDTLTARVGRVEDCVDRISADVSEMRGRQEERDAATERRLNTLEQGMERGFGKLFDKIDEMRKDFSDYREQRAGLNGKQDTTLAVLKDRISLRSTLIIAVAAASPGLVSAVILLIQTFGDK
ncbi:MAG: hypothetical protein JW885_02770 [Deltaproteobacteria bacterium]|nr:hypothetical protein [Candidatus Zymogenaceae bacterium]